MEDLKEDWDNAISGDILDVRDGTHDTPKYVTESIHPLVTSKNLKNGSIDFSDVKYISNEDFNEINKRSKVDIGDILFAMIGTIGNPVVVKKEPHYSIKNIGLFKNRVKIIESELLKNFLDSLNFYSQLEKRQLLKGTTQKFIPLGHLRNIFIPIAPLPIQRAIVLKIENLFASLDKGIADLEKAQQQLKVYRQAVLKKAFEGGLTNKNIKEGKLPESWKKLSLGDIVNRNSQKALPSEMPNAKFIGMDCIEANTLKPFKFYDFKEFKSAGNVFKVNQVLYGRMRPYLNKVYKAEIDGTCSGEFIVLDCKDDFNPDLLKYILHHRDFVSFANHKTSGDRPRISFEEIIDYPVNVCKPVEQAKIVREIESRLSVCDKVEQSIAESLAKSKALRQSILKKAFEGKLLSEDEIDKCKQEKDYEPAGVLLERIKTEKRK